VPPEQYAAIVHEAAGVVAGSSISVGQAAIDKDLKLGFDRVSAEYPWSDR
jgi:hypothetical protein